MKHATNAPLPLRRGDELAEFVPVAIDGDGEADEPGTPWRESERCGVFGECVVVVVASVNASSAQATEGQGDLGTSWPNAAAATLMSCNDENLSDAATGCHPRGACSPNESGAVISGGCGCTISSVST